MILETERLILRPFTDEDAPSVYRYASDPEVGPPAGWPPHTSEEVSLNIIRNVLSRPTCFAVCLKTDGEAIGAADLRTAEHTDMTDREDECELGYWLGRPFWGLGIMPEAAGELLRYGFEDLGMKKIWAGYYDGNERSRRVQQKLGFAYQWTTEGLDVPQMGEKRTGHVSALTKEAWEARTGRSED